MRAAQLATDRQLDKIVGAIYQHVEHIDSSTIRPMFGRVLIRDVHDDSQANGIFIPENIEKHERNRIGVVVAVGLGDKWIEMKERGPWGVIRRKAVVDANGALTRLPMDVKPGDKVLYTRRREAEIELGGETLTLAYLEQAVLGVLED